MDLYLMIRNSDNSFSPYKVIDDFTDLIWTERYSDVGEVTIVLPTDSPNRALFTAGAYVSIPQSKEIMRIKTLTDEDGACTMTGVTLVDILKDRLVRTGWGGKDHWQRTGVPGYLVKDIVYQMTVSGLINTGTIFSRMTYEQIPNMTTLDYDNTGIQISVPVPYDTVFNAVQMICNLDGLGFQLIPDVPNGSPANTTLSFRTWRGKDRTTDNYAQNKVIVFEPALDSLVDIKTLESIDGYKNVAYVYTSDNPNSTHAIAVYAPGFDPNTMGFDRFTLAVEVSDVNYADYSSNLYALDDLLLQKGNDALANNNYVRMSDGQIVPQTSFVYGIDYFLGDVIELRNTTSVAQKARITEYIRSQDSTGERSYPTLSIIS